MARTVIARTPKGTIGRDGQGSLDWTPTPFGDVPFQSQWKEFLGRRTVLAGEDKHKMTGAVRYSYRWEGLLPMICAVCYSVVNWFDAEPIAVASRQQFKEWTGEYGEYQGERMSIMRWVVVSASRRVAACKQCQGDYITQLAKGPLDVMALVMAEAENGVTRVAGHVEATPPMPAVGMPIPATTEDQVAKWFSDKGLLRVEPKRLRRRL